MYARFLRVDATAFAIMLDGMFAVSLYEKFVL